MAQEQQNSVDNFGNVYQGTTYVGYLEDGKCFDLNGQTFACPELADNKTTAVTINSKQTYIWVLLLAIIIVTIFAAWFINRK